MRIYIFNCGTIGVIGTDDITITNSITNTTFGARYAQVIEV